jgi:hypothetical protein
MREGNKIYVCWNKDEKKVKKNNDSYCLDSQLVRVILVKLENLNVNDFSEGYLIKGYTRATTKTTEGNKIIFYAHLFFQGKRWYDWAYVHFEEINTSGDVVENYYPAGIINFVTINGITEAVIHCLEKPLKWTDAEESFIVKTNNETRFEILNVTVPISALVHPLYAIPDYGSESTLFNIVLPKCNWSHYFGDKFSTVEQNNV